MEHETKFYTLDQAEKEAEKQSKKLQQEYPEQQGIYSTEQYEKADKELKEKQIELIQELTEAGSIGHLIGGFACDLLISGDFTNPHTDVDVAVLREREEELRGKLSTLGYKVNKKIENDPQNPHKLYLTDSGPLKGDFALINIDPTTGEPYIEVKLKGDKVANLYFSPDMLSHEPQSFQNKLLQVVSPRSLIQTLLFYNQIDRAQLRDKDLIRAQKLIEKYFPGENIDSDLFKVRIEEIKSDQSN